MSRMFILVLPHKENKLHPIHRTIKSQDDFNMNLKLLLENIVVICLKNRTFAVSQTTDHPRRQERHVLWFAWKIVLLQYRKQLLIAKQFLQHSCDLLEKSYFCSIANSQCEIGLSGIMLWFAWKIVLLQYHKQHIDQCWIVPASCDLLGKSYFCSITNSLRFADYIWS